MEKAAKAKAKPEVWRDVPGYEGYYQASDMGRVRSVGRTVLTKNGQERFYKGKIIDGSNMDGYKQLALSRDGKRKSFLIHQLVAICFLDHTPDGHKFVIDHIDGDKLNNNVENLQIVTNRDNLSTCHRNDGNILSSKFTGVNWHKNSSKWESKIQYEGKQIYLGLYDNELDASNAYQKALGKINDNTFNPEDYKPKFTSKYKGVSFKKNRKKWVAQSYINGKQTYLGSFATEEEAHQAIQNINN